LKCAAPASNQKWKDVIRFDHDGPYLCDLPDSDETNIRHRWPVHARKMSISSGGFVMDHIIECPKHQRAI